MKRIFDSHIRISVRAHDICATVLGQSADEAAGKLSHTLDKGEKWGKE